MAASAKEAFDAGASVMHVHFRMQAPGMGHLPSWQPEVAKEICDAIRAACPGVIINMSTGVIGDDISGPEACMREVQPEVAACNAGSLNYLKTRRDGSWAWPPMLFDNPVPKVEKFLGVMKETGARPEFECFDVGIVRSINLFKYTGLRGNLINFVMGVASGMLWMPALRIAQPICTFRRSMADNTDWTSGDLACPSPYCRAWRQPSDWGRGHVLFAEWRKVPRKRRPYRSLGCDSAGSRSRNCVPSRSTRIAPFELARHKPSTSVAQRQEASPNKGGSP